MIPSLRLVQSVKPDFVYKVSLHSFVELVPSLTTLQLIFPITDGTVFNLGAPEGIKVISSQNSSL